jgi:hypothetical protein
MKGPLLQSRLEKALVVLAVFALDVALLLWFPAQVAFAALVATVTIAVLLALRAIIQYGNKGPGQTLY